MKKISSARWGIHPARTVKQYVDDAREKGARVLCGGAPSSGVGSEFGLEGLKAYTVNQVVSVAKDRR